MIQEAVIEHLAWRGIAGLWFTHFPAGEHRSRVTGAILKGMGMKAGVPDLLLLARGRLYGLELKAGGRRPSPEQIATHAHMREAGAVVGVAAGVDEALALLRIWGLLR